MLFLFHLSGSHFMIDRREREVKVLNLWGNYITFFYNLYYGQHNREKILNMLADCFLHSAADISKTHQNLEIVK